MTGFVNALLLGTGLSLFSGALLWALLTRFTSKAVDVTAWRLARCACLLPMLAAPVVHAIPEHSPGNVASPIEWHAPLDNGRTVATIETGSTQRGAGISARPAIVINIYLAGLLISLSMAARRHRRRRNILAASKLPDSDTRRLIEALLPDCESPTPPIRISSAITSPALTGWNGIILIPEALLSDHRALQIGLHHELAHWRRGDERDRLLGSALTTIFWFHLPLRWIESELDAVRELACDADALATLGTHRRQLYAETLITTLRNALPGASAFGPQDRRHRRMRIKSILSDRKPAPMRTVGFAAALISAVGPAAVAQALWTDRVDAPARVERIQPHPEVMARDSAELTFGEPAPQPEIDAAAAPRPAPVDISFGASTAPAPSLQLPIEGGRVSSAYGPRPERPASAPLYHHGTDIAAPEGTAILAPADGQIVHASYGFNGNEAWGNTLIIDHGDGWQTVYAHMQGFDVETGDSVSAGQQVGRVGNTGRSTGPHLHLEVRHNGERRDPANYFSGLR